MLNLKVHKYYISPLMKNQSTHIPYDAKIIHVGDQSGHLAVWAEVNASDTYPTKFKTVDVFTTGDFAPITEDNIYIGTVVMHDGSYVWHIYERKSA